MTYTIVAGIDGSIPSRTMVEWSVKRAATMSPDAELLLIHVIDTADGDGELGADELRTTASRMLEEETQRARSLHPHLSVRAELLEGPLVGTLIAAATEADADLIVVGTHKTGFSRGRLFGSRSLQIAAESTIPVAIIPESSRRLRSGIVVGVDESNGGAAAIEFAAAEAERTNQELTLIRCWEPPMSRTGEAESIRMAEKAYETQAKRRLSDAVVLIHQHHRTLVTRSRSIRRPAADALLDAATSASLLVIGDASDTHSDRASLGDVGHDVLLNLVGPTVLVHTRRSGYRQSTA